MADQTAAEVFVERLIEWGVDTIFGLPGDGINGFMEALGKSMDRIRQDSQAYDLVGELGG
jgi:pyruvate dehydrogenase (quinone)/pyruvate oxidase